MVWNDIGIFPRVSQIYNSMFIGKKRIVTAITVLFIAAIFTSYARELENRPYRFHELTLYAIPSPTEFDWSSPGTLYQSYMKGLLSAVIHPNTYSLGHMFVKMTSPLLEEPLYAGMTSVSRKEQQTKVLKEKIGLAILGIGLEGRMESGSELEKMIRHHAGRNRLAALTYRISESAAYRILSFLDEFDTPNEGDHIPSSHYGGTFWPLYEDEGAGCTSFGIAILELAGIQESELEQWKARVNIPMKLIGGNLNKGNKVNIRDIRRSEKWFEGPGEAGEDYIPFWVYEPNKIYNWIMAKSSDMQVRMPPHYVNASYTNVPRLFADFSHIEIPHDNPIFTRRSDDNPFIHQFLDSNGLLGIQAEQSEQQEDFN